MTALGLSLTLLLLLPHVALGWLESSHPAEAWHLLYPKIRDRLIDKESARETMRSLEISLKALYRQNGHVTEEAGLFFPLMGYGPNAIGGRNGSGYHIEGYDFFDGNRHKGHPGHDIFIRDRNQDGLDDITGKPVLVVAASSGIVVSINLGWEPSSPVRGGNYVWVYDPLRGRYFYYAHLTDVLVGVGQIVSKGEPLGTVGRTGVNAYKKRSPTHLHFTVHESRDGYPRPVNPYPELVKRATYP